MLGHSIGEYVAACRSGVMDVDTAIALVAARGKAMVAMAPGKMLSIGASEADVKAMLPEALDIAVLNSAANTVVSGPADAIEAFAAELAEKQITARVLHTSHGFHSRMMEPALATYRQAFAGVTLNKPSIPFVSNLTGEWITDEQAQSVDYWLDQLRHCVRFGDGINTLVESGDYVMLEVGPGDMLSRLAGAHEKVLAQNTLPSTGKTGQAVPAYNTRAVAAGRCWLAGVAPDWNEYYGDEQRHRVSLPGYAFDRKSYWIPEITNLDAKARPQMQVEEEAQLSGIEDTMASVEKAELNLSVNWADNDASAVKDPAKLQAMLKLRKQIAELCAEANSQSGLNVQLSSLDLHGLPVQDENFAAQTAATLSTGREGIMTPYVPGETDLQETLIGHWEETLGLSPIGIDDNFFDLGGHSLLAAAIANKLRGKFDLALPLEELLLNPTIRQLAELLETQLWLKKSAAEGDVEEDELEEGAL